MIKIESLSHTYERGDRLEFPEWEINGMAHWLLLGASGSGKSTLLNHIAGLLKPTEGKIMVDDQDLYQLSAKEIDHFRGMNIGVVFQRPHLISSLNVIENLEVANTLAGNVVNSEHILSLLEDLSLQSKHKNYPHQLSQGQLQRVSIARALVNKPLLLIADEPTSSLDDDNTHQVMEILLEQAINNSAALIIATHDQRVRQYITNSYLL